MGPAPPNRLVVGVTGATGVPFAIRLLEWLARADIESHLIVSRWGARTLVHETSQTLADLRRLATVSYAPDDQGARVSSGSFLTAGMAIVPCSMKTLAAIAHGHGDDLIHRTADVMLKERRTLLLAVRETPLNGIHLENMLKLSRMGAVIFPPVPAFYHRPTTLDQVIDQTVLRILDQFGFHLESDDRWDGRMETSSPAS